MSGKTNQQRIKELSDKISEEENRLNQISERLTTSENNWGKIEQHQQTANQVKGEINTKRDEANNTLNEIIQLKQNAEENRDEINELVDLANQGKESFDNHNGELKKIKEKIDNFAQEIEKQLSVATEGTLANAFATRQTKVEKEMHRWRKNLYWSIFILLIIGVGFFIYSFWAEIDYQFVLKLSISIPAGFAVWFSGLQYNKERKIVEQYAFKSATSKSLSAFSKIVHEIYPEGKDKQQNFLTNSIDKIFLPPDLTQEEEYPLKKVMKEVRGIIKDLPKIN